MLAVDQYQLILTAHVNLSTEIKNQNQTEIYYQGGFYTNEEFVLMKKVHALKTITKQWL